MCWWRSWFYLLFKIHRCTSTEMKVFVKIKQNDKNQKHVKNIPISQYNYTQGCLLYLKLSDIRKNEFDRVFCCWNIHFSVLFNDAICKIDMGNSFLFFFISVGASSQITLSKWCFFYTMFHPLPYSYRGWHLNFWR